MINTGGASQAKIEEQDKDITAMVKQIALLNIKIEELEAELKSVSQAKDAYYNMYLKAAYDGKENKNE